MCSPQAGRWWRCRRPSDERRHRRTPPAGRRRRARRRRRPGPRRRRAADGRSSAATCCSKACPASPRRCSRDAFARALGVEFRRVQFTPDMLPSDLTGTMTLRGGELAFRPGPVFTNLLLADEINRTPPKTQAALLEAMQERQVTRRRRDAGRCPSRSSSSRRRTRSSTRAPTRCPRRSSTASCSSSTSATRARTTRSRCCASRTVASRPPTLDDVRPVVDADELLEARATVDATHRRRRVARLRRRARAPHARAAERRARREPARRGAPARRGEGRGAARRPRLRHARRRRRAWPRPVLRHRLVLRPEAELERYRAATQRDRERSGLGARATVTPTPRAAYALAVSRVARRWCCRSVSSALAAVVARGGRPRARRAARYAAAVGEAVARSAPSRAGSAPPLGRDCADRPRGVASPPGAAGRCSSSTAGRRTERSPATVAGARARRATCSARSGPRGRGPLGLGACYSRAGASSQTARLSRRRRRGGWSWPRARAGSATRAACAVGPLGLGTDFESIRDYLPDDDVRQINWTASRRASGGR